MSDSAMPCPYHADAPRVCSVCGARCAGSPSGKQCKLEHDMAAHSRRQGEPVTLTPMRAYDDEDEDDGRYGA